MTDTHFKEYMMSLGFSTSKEAEKSVFIDVHVTTVRKWWNGDRKPPEVAYTAIKWYLKCAELEDRLKKIEEIAGVEDERDTNGDTAE